MTWQDRIENSKFSISTGDGTVFYPLWKNGETSKEFNQSTFDFINKTGSFIDRRQPKARRFPLTFWFQGPDNIDQAEAFDQASNDPRPWLIEHPFYGNITCQPLTIARNDTAYNVTEFTVEVLETLEISLPVARVSLPELAAARFASYSDTASINYAAKTLPGPSDVAKAQDSTTKLSAIIKPILDGTTYADFQAKKNKMISSVDSLIAAPVTAVQTIHQVELSPAEFKLAIKTRLQTLQSIYASLRIDYIPKDFKAFVKQ